MIGVELNEKNQEAFSLYKLELNIKTDEFKVKCLVNNIELNKEKLQIGVNYNVSFLQCLNY